MATATPAPTVPVELDELEDAVIDALLLVASAMESSNSQLIESAISSATTIGRLLPGDHSLRERVLDSLDTLSGDQALAASEAARNELLDLVSELNDLNEARLPEAERA